MTENPWYRDGRLHYGVGIEDTFIPHEKLGHRKLDEYELTQHYMHWREDLDLVAESGATFVRWGVPWYLVEPEPGVFDWSWLDQVAAHMQKLGLRCIVDLMHYGTPLWLENAFLNGSYPERMASYAAAVAERYRDVWHDYTPMNEPVVNAEWCGLDGSWPPYLEGYDGFVRVMMQLARGMVRAQQEIERVAPDVTIVHVDAGFRYEGDTGEYTLEFLNERRFLALDLITGRIDESAPLYDWLIGHGVTDAELQWLRENKVSPDIVGVNYYPRFTTLTYPGGNRDTVRSDTPGLRDLVKLYAARYERPIIITESSLVGTAEEKIEWLRESRAELDRLREEGHDVVGFTWFPFFTLVDWQYRFEQNKPDDWFMAFGLIDLVRGADLNLERRKNAAFSEFQALASKHA